jgi:transcriptional regulator with XRE-family HTH domain
MNDKTSPERGERLRTWREAAGLTQRELARQLGVHHSNIQFWESGAVPPRSEVLAPMAKLLGVRVEQLLGQEGKRPPLPAPAGRARVAFDKVSKLPKRQQEKILEVVEALLKQHADARAT